MDDWDQLRERNGPLPARSASGLRRLGSIPLWCWWILLVWAVSFPWTGLTAQPQWHRVHWIPFEDPADKMRDVVANVALLVPFGYSFAGRREGLSRVIAALAVAAAVSFSAEAMQLFSSSRYPSATDVSSAIAGAAIGAAWRAWEE